MYTSQQSLSKPTLLLPAPSQELVDVDELATPVRGPREERITLKHFNKLTLHGCAYCSGDIAVEEANAGSIHWIGEPVAPVHDDCLQSYIAGQAVL